MSRQMPPRSGPQCSLTCSEPVTYSERGHPLAGDYCDSHGMAIHRLRRGAPCSCRHCNARNVIRQTERIREAARDRLNERLALAEAEEPDAD